MAAVNRAGRDKMVQLAQSVWLQSMVTRDGEPSKW
jgi:hypothetical protein